MSKFNIGDLVVANGPRNSRRLEDGIELGIVTGLNDNDGRMTINMYKIRRDRIARYDRNDCVSYILCNLVIPTCATLHFLLQSVGIFINKPGDVDSELEMDTEDSYGFKRAIEYILFENRFDSNTFNKSNNNVYIPKIKNVYFNNPLTVVIWEDGTKTFVKNNDGDDKYDPEKALAMAISKKALGNKYSYYDEIFKWMPSNWRNDYFTKEIYDNIIKNLRTEAATNDELICHKGSISETIKMGKGVKEWNIKEQVIVDKHNRCEVHVIYNDNDTTIIVMSKLTGKKEFVMLPPKCSADMIRGFIDSLIDVVSQKFKEDKE